VAAVSFGTYSQKGDIQLKIDIHRLFDHWEENEIALSGDVDAEQIWLRTKQRITVKKRRKPLVRRMLIAAVVCLLLTCGISAAVQYWTGKYEYQESIRVQIKENHEATFPAQYVITFTPEKEPERPNIVSFRYEWIPYEVTDDDVDSTSLQEMLNYQKIDTRELDEWLLQESYTRIVSVDPLTDGRNKENERFPDTQTVYNIDVYHAEQIKGTRFLGMYETELLKQGEFGGREAMWVKQEYPNAVCRMLLLYDQTYGCVVKVGVLSSGYDAGFDEVEKIAEHLTLIDTGIPAPPLEFDNNWMFLGVGVG